MINNYNYSSYDQYGMNVMETVGPVALIAMPGSVDFVNRINSRLYKRRLQYLESNPELLYKNPGFMRESYLIDANLIRFASGEGKATLDSTVRGHDLYLITDFLNHSITYDLFEQPVPMSPDDHFQDLVRVILACSGKARRINVIMPYLYESRQSVRVSRESLDCAYMLNELKHLGVENIITFDPHDPGIENALPINSIEGLPVTYQMIKALLRNVPDLIVQGEENCAMAVSSDEKGMKRAIFYSSMLGIPLGTFYRQRDFSLSVQGKNPVVDYHFLGDPPMGRDILIIDDMIVSGNTFLETARKLKEHNAGRIYAIITFGLFVNGIEEFNKAYEERIFDKILCTNANYHEPELLNAPWYINVDITKYTALVIDAMNHDVSISSLIDQRTKIGNLLRRHQHHKDFTNLAE
jgi:ribose-phosphate pyrophosphokinase